MILMAVNLYAQDRTSENPFLAKDDGEKLILSVINGLNKYKHLLFLIFL